MEPDVRYCTTADGVRIAYTVTGSGPVHVHMVDPLVSHVRLEWSHPVSKRIAEEAARHNTLVHFDLRGSGLSERVLPTSLEACVLDIEAVVDRLQLEPFILFGHFVGARVGISFAAQHPDQVRMLILLNASITFPDLPPTAPHLALRALADYDWETYTEVLAGLYWGWAAGEQRTQYAKVLRASMTWDDTRRGRDVPAAHTFLSQITAPTLVVHHQETNITSLELGRRLAAQVPDARLVTLEGTALVSAIGDPRMRAAVEEFERMWSMQSPEANLARSSGVRTVLFSDLVGHTEMMRRLGDAGGREVLREHERITREAIGRHGGAEIKTDGDSFMVSFGSVAAAMECAIGLQQAFASRNETGVEPLRVRIGLNAGEPIEEAGDLFGEAVILAARIAAQAGEGEIFIAEPVRHLLAGKGFVFADRGEFLPKGFEDAVRLFEVRWRP